MIRRVLRTGGTARLRGGERGIMEGEQRRQPGRSGIPAPSAAAAAVVLAALTLLMFGDVLVSKTEVLSAPETDLFQQFLPWRAFAVSEIKKGHLPLWNPHLFSGAPFLAGFQSALLYPLNLPYLLLPLNTAVNVGIALHVFLLGLFTFLWVRRRGLHPLAALTAGIVVMFSGPHFLHIYAGHLPNLCAMAWVPLILLSLDGLMKKRTSWAILLGAFAFAMLVLAGHPQYAYYTALVCALYLAVSFPFAMDRRADEGAAARRKGALAAFAAVSLAAAGVFAFGLLLAAAQVLPGLAAAREAVRAGGVPFSFAAMFSFPPENLLTLVSPYLFGDMIHTPYWGRGYLWEMELFVGLTALYLAARGVVTGGGPAKALGLAALLCLLLALGKHTPLFGALYHYLPGFDRFRGTAKFIFYFALLTGALAAYGLDGLIGHAKGDAGGEAPSHPGRGGAVGGIVILGLALAAALAASWLHLAAAGTFSLSPWDGLLRSVALSGESYLPQEFFLQEDFARFTAKNAALGMTVCLVTLVLLAAALRLPRRRPAVTVWLLVILAAGEVFLFSLWTRVSFDPAAREVPALTKFLKGIDGEARILNLWHPNGALAAGAYDIWGHDPLVPRRYAELIALTQGLDPKEASQYIRFERYHPLLGMLRLRYVIIPTPTGLTVRQFPPGLGRLTVLYDWRVEATDEGALKALADRAFDPARLAILPKAPPFERRPCPGGGEARILSSETGRLTLEARLACPGLLLVTDNYDGGWQARPLGARDERTYEILRANHTLMAVPLPAGEHRLELAYRPREFTLGLYLSAAAWAVFGVMILVSILKTPRRERSDTEG